MVLREQKSLSKRFSGEATSRVGLNGVLVFGIHMFRAFMKIWRRLTLIQTWKLVLLVLNLEKQA
jgi:hypothetical protein